jgi:hypothetical protein
VRSGSLNLVNQTGKHKKKDLVFFKYKFLMGSSDDESVGQAAGDGRLQANDQTHESEGSGDKKRASENLGSREEANKSDSDVSNRSQENRANASSSGLAAGGSSIHGVRLIPRTSMLSRREAKRPNIVGASRTLAAQRTSFKAGFVKHPASHPAVRYPISASQQDRSKPFFTKWNEFQRKNWGKGWSREEMRRKYKVRDL